MSRINIQSSRGTVDLRPVMGRKGPPGPTGPGADITGAELDAARDAAVDAAAAAEAHRDDVLAVVATNDGIITAIDADPASAFRLQQDERLDDHLPFADPKWFGATYDGVTDDTGAVQAALDAASYVVITGHARVSSVTFDKDNGVLECLAGGRLLSDGSANDLLTVAGDFSVLRHVLLIGSGNCRAAIRTTGFRAFLLDCTVTGTQQYGLDADGLETSVIMGKFKGGTGAGILVNKPDLYLANVYTEQNRDGIHASGVGSITAHHVHSYGNTRHGFYLSGASFSQLVSCYADTNGNDGYQIRDSSQGLTLIDCWAFKSSDDAPSYQDFFLLNVQNTVLSGCRASGVGGASKNYTFRTNSTCEVTLLGCYADTSAGVDLQGTISVRSSKGALTRLNTPENKTHTAAQSIATGAATTATFTLAMGPIADIVTPGFQAFDVTIKSRKNDNSDAQVDRFMVTIGTQASLTKVRTLTPYTPWVLPSSLSIAPAAYGSVATITMTLTNSGGGQTVQASAAIEYLGTGRGTT